MNFDEYSRKLLILMNFEESYEINVALLTIGDDCYCSRIAMGFVSLLLS